jgi:hypothetical protein
LVFDFLPPTPDFPHFSWKEGLFLPRRLGRVGVMSAWMALLLAVATLEVRAELGPWNEDAAAAWFAAHPGPVEWKAALPERVAALAARYEAQGSRVFQGDADFVAWLDHVRWVRLGLELKALESDADLRRAFVELGCRPGPARMLLQALHPLDDAPRALEILLRLQLAAPEDLAEYAALGAAYAVVFDQPFPRDWPHHQVDPAQVPMADLDPTVRFADLVAAQRAKKLEHDPRQLQVEELKFVVDTQVALTELEWARREIKLSLSKFGRAYQSIRYDTRRAVDGIFDWPQGSYRLRDILEKGGICVDQAYYAATVGKARGIPTLYFSGQGAAGGHAWFGYMEKPGKWDMDCGRYESQNYPVGEALDPQTWRPINDAELNLMVADLPRQPTYGAARAALAWALMAGNPEAFLARLREARALMPGLPDTWRVEEAYLKKSGAAADVRKAFYTEWIRQFDKQTDFKVYGQNQLLALLKEANDPAAAELQKEIVRENRRKRFDLGIGAGVEGIFTHIEAGNWKEAEREFKRVVRRFDDKGGGNLFYQLIQPYVLTCAEEGKWDLAQDAIKYAEKRMPVEPDSILRREFDRLQMMVARRLRPAPETP